MHSAKAAMALDTLGADEMENTGGYASTMERNNSGVLDAILGRAGGKQVGMNSPLSTMKASSQRGPSAPPVAGLTPARATVAAPPKSRPTGERRVGGRRTLTSTAKAQKKKLEEETALFKAEKAAAMAEMAALERELQAIK